MIGTTVTWPCMTGRLGRSADRESTARDAYYRDFRVFFLADGTGTVNEQMHVASLINLGFGFAYVTTVHDVLRQLAGADEPR